MTSASKLIQASAGNAAGEGLAVEDVFSTYLYEGNGSSQTITNGIDLDGEGGLVWIKNRDSAENHGLVDTEANGLLFSNLTNAINTGVTHTFNSNGFTVGSAGAMNDNGDSHVSWTFRKAPKFFDVVTYTGNGVAGRTVSHNLGSVPGCMIVKVTNASDDWRVYHRGVHPTAPEDYVLYLNDTRARTDVPRWNDTPPTSTEFTLGSDSSINGSGLTYVAYLFAHNNNDGGFGEDADQDIIKCGSFTFASGQETADIGFEPQWLLAKRTDGAGDWIMFDAMRGFTANSGGGFGRRLLSNSSAAETNNDGLYYKSATSIGLNLPAYGDYIYIAIRRGPMKTPTLGTEVFDVNYETEIRSSSGWTSESGFVTDAFLTKQTTLAVGTYVFDRVRGTGFLRTNETTAESSTNYVTFDTNNGVKSGSSGLSGSSVPYADYHFRRAPGFLDLVAYTGDGTTSRTVNHGLGVVPEMMWVKRRGSTGEWKVYHQALNETKEIVLNSSGTAASSDSFNNTAPTETVFSVGQSYLLNASDTYIAYLFATVPGVSKVGSYTGNGTSQTINCGFSAGARFVMTKRTNTDGNWNVWDSERGIVAGNDPRLELNTSDAEDTGHDYIDPDSSGFVVNYVADDNDDSNVSGDTYIFLAIA